MITNEILTSCFIKGWSSLYSNSYDLINIYNNEFN